MAGATATSAAQWDSNTWEGDTAALVIAHPGHELRVHHWVERARPITFTLTDGSGYANGSRIASTTAVLQRAGARPGAIFGPMSDHELYQAILAGHQHVFAPLVETLALELRRAGISYVVGDAVEGFNPGHDVCRLLLNAAVLRIEAATGRRLGNLEYLLEGPPDHDREEELTGSIMLTLEEEAYRRKIAAANSYPEMAREVSRSVAAYGAAKFRTECLRPVHYGFDIASRLSLPCFYEEYGKGQVAGGRYREVIRFREHIAPLASYIASLIHE